ncbi:hypothetical protein K439DRAFT_406945 [Ramaria rubella]|nr:hypothetical protein K439DRAFT_406945 [Ramaria rubella]
MRASPLEEHHHERDGATSLNPHPSPLPNHNLSLSSLHCLYGPTAPASAPLTHCAHDPHSHHCGLSSRSTSQRRRTADVFDGRCGEHQGRVDAASVTAATQAPARADAWSIEYGGCAVSEGKWGDVFYDARCGVGVVSSEIWVLEIRVDVARLWEIDRVGGAEGAAGVVCGAGRCAGVR